jgi:hypothetical protein
VLSLGKNSGEDERTYHYSLPAGVASSPCQDAAADADFPGAPAWPEQKPIDLTSQRIEELMNIEVTPKVAASCVCTPAGRARTQRPFPAPRLRAPRETTAPVSGGPLARLRLGYQRVFGQAPVGANGRLWHSARHTVEPAAQGTVASGSRGVALLEDHHAESNDLPAALSSSRAKRGAYVGLS